MPLPHLLISFLSHFNLFLLKTYPSPQSRSQTSLGGIQHPDFLFHAQSHGQSSSFGGLQISSCPSLLDRISRAYGVLVLSLQQTADPPLLVKKLPRPEQSFLMSGGARSRVSLSHVHEYFWRKFVALTRETEARRVKRVVDERSIVRECGSLNE